MNINDGADFWRNEIGCNVIPVDSKAKKPLIPWKEWQNNSISEEQHERWKKDGSYKSGIAIITGKLWRGPHKDKYLVCIDCDNKSGYDEFLHHCFSEVKTLEELAPITIVEQHLDNKNKAHIYLITEKAFVNRGGINNTKEKEETIPAIEVKSEGKSYVVCTPSIHQNGHKYDILGTKIPYVFDREQTENLEKHLNQIYSKYRNSANENNENFIPTEELFKEDFIVTEGNNRHVQLLRAMESSIINLRNTLDLSQIKQASYKWNQKHCKPPLDYKEFEKQWNCAIKFVESTRASNNTRQRKENGYIEKLINISPPVFYYADASEKKIGRYKVETITDEITGKKYPVEIFSNIIIDAIPKRIFIYKNNPLLKNTQERIKIIFESSIVDDFEVGPYDSVEAILKELQNKHLIVYSKTANDALSCIINAYKEKKMVETIEGITTKGYYLLDGKIKAVEATQNVTHELDKYKIKECVEFLNYLATKGWKNKNIFPTVLKWGVVAPFGFSIKFNSDDWFPWLQLYGSGQTGKTTIGNIILSIWNLDKKDKSIGFNNIDSVARFGYTISKDTYPILVNEVGPLSTNNFGKYTSIVELLKHSVESIICRGKFIEGKNYQEILALSPMILTSNYTPPNDGSFNRRFVSVHFPEEEKKEIQEQEEFKSKFNENKKNLSVLGDFTASYIIDNPSVLINKKWTDISKEILARFYEFAQVPVPEWIEYFEEQRDAIDESSEKTLFELRAFFINKINDAYAKYQRLAFVAREIDLQSKLEYCLQNKIIPFIMEIEKDILIITVDIMKELRFNQNIENLTGLKDIGAQIGFEYTSKNVNSKKSRVLLGNKANLIKFLIAEIK